MRPGGTQKASPFGYVLIIKDTKESKPERGLWPWCVYPWNLSRNPLLPSTPSLIYYKCLFLFPFPLFPFAFLFSFHPPTPHACAPPQERFSAAWKRRRNEDSVVQIPFPLFRLVLLVLFSLMLLVLVPRLVVEH
ncbi:hypothetical protein K438DRAFT_1989044 [Mycena galopus ATCC 62051]|nr:hypothetical protein K438DRAFT_1989044 [Mycena galopus ATCC 62051]